MGVPKVSPGCDCVLIPFRRQGLHGKQGQPISTRLGILAAFHVFS